MKKFRTLIFITVIGLVFLTFIGAAANESKIYKVFVDQDYGFKRVIEINYTPFIYQNLTLNLNAGDTVIWVNDATDNSSFTIISEQDLWDNKSAYLRFAYRFFNYTFTQSGTYGVYIKEYPRLHHQTIVVKSIETPTPTATPTQTTIATPTLTPTVKETPIKAIEPTFNLVYILIAVLVVVGIILLFYYGKTSSKK